MDIVFHGARVLGLFVILWVRHAQYPLADGPLWQHFADQVCGAVGHTASAATWAEATTLQLDATSFS